MAPKIKRLIHAICIILFIVGTDQLSKAWILNHLMDPPSLIPIFPFLDFVLTWNKGIGFGFLKADTSAGIFALIIMALTISTVLGIWLWRTADNLLLVSLSMIIGGAIGNIIDRLCFGAVVDFIYVHVYIFGHHFPAFNVADSAITAGVCLLLLENYMRKESDAAFPSRHS